MENILIVNSEEFEKKKQAFIKDGKDKMHVLSDFDRTLTKGVYRDKRAGSIIQYLRNGNYLSKDYVSRANSLFDKYHPIEIDNKIPIKDKINLMYEWWRKHFDLLIEVGLDLNTIKKAAIDIIKEESLDFRAGCLEFFNVLKENKIPLIIISSSVGDMIIEFMKQKKVFFENIYIISNLLDFDKSGKVIGVKEIIHVFNKHEIEIKNLPIYKELLKRKNIILLGDSIGDLGMVEKFKYENIIRICFLNENISENLEDFKKNYDVIILNDGDMRFVNELLSDITK